MHDSLLQRRFPISVFVFVFFFLNSAIVPVDLSLFFYP